MKLLFVLFTISLASFEADRVASFSAQPVPPEQWGFKLYSGFLDIPNSEGRSHHYVFQTAKNNPDTAPLLLWLNGGPGCSSMLGWMYETGPFVFWHDLDKTLTVNPYSWNNYLNVIYMESPAGVGWSLYNNTENLNADDYRTAHDNYFALQSFLNKFPEYKGRDFYITSESYGGIYGPSLAYVIHEWNKNASSTQLNFINLKGFGILNGVVSTKYDVNAATPTYNWDHFMYGQTSRELYLQNCQEKFDQEKCDEAWNLLVHEAMGTNPYDIYRDCLPAPFQEERLHSEHLYRFSFKDFVPWCAPAMNLYTLLGSGLGGQTNVSCLDLSAEVNILNQEETRKQFNIPKEAPEWATCSGILNYTAFNWGDGTGVLWIYEDFLKDGQMPYKALIFSGDTDSCVPTNGNRDWLATLNLDVDEEWHPWMADGQQISGYRETYKQGVEFVTVRGVGHMATQWKRYDSYLYINYWAGIGKLSDSAIF